MVHDQPEVSQGKLSMLHPVTLGTQHAVGTGSVFAQWEKNNKVDSSMDPTPGLPGDRAPSEGPGSSAEVFKIWEFSFCLLGGGEGHRDASLICDSSFSRLCQLNGKAFLDVLWIIYDPHTQQANQHTNSWAYGSGISGGEMAEVSMLWSGGNETLRLYFYFLHPDFPKAGALRFHFRRWMRTGGNGM